MKDSIQDMIDVGEGYRLEFKESLEKSFIEEVCAFANSRGGFLIRTTQNLDHSKPIQIDEIS